MILVLRTDKPEAEVGFYEGSEQLKYKIWQAHRELSETLHTVIAEQLKSLNKDWSDITGIVFYKGPGSFTGLRIGASVANAIAVTQNIPCVSRNGENWIDAGMQAVSNGVNEAALPEYGSEPRITKPKK